MCKAQYTHMLGIPDWMLGDLFSVVLHLVKSFTSVKSGCKVLTNKSGYVLSPLCMGVNDFIRYRERVNHRTMIWHPEFGDFHVVEGFSFLPLL